MRRLSLDITQVQAEMVRDEDGQPSLLIRVGDVLIEFSGGGEYAESLAGARRIHEALWNYGMAVSARRLLAEAAVTVPNGHPGWETLSEEEL